MYAHLSKVSVIEPAHERYRIPLNNYAPLSKLSQNITYFSRSIWTMEHAIFFKDTKNAFFEPGHRKHGMNQ